MTAHGSPGGPLQFDRLEAALAANFRRNCAKILRGTAPFYVDVLIGFDGPGDRVSSSVGNEFISSRKRQSELELQVLGFGTWTRPS